MDATAKRSLLRQLDRDPRPVVVAMTTKMSGNEDPDVPYILGRAQFRLGEFSAAEKSFRSAIALLDALSAKSFHYLGLSLERQGRTDDAVKAYRTATYLDPNLPEPKGKLPQLPPVHDQPGDRAGAADNRRGALPKPPGPAYPPQSQNSLVGVVTDLKQGIAPWLGNVGAIDVWRFEVVAYDTDDCPLPPIGVEMKGDDISGVLKSGHWVEIDEWPRPGETLKPKRVRNLSNCSVIKRTWRVPGTILKVIQGR
jgi:tetratricopeptide (TPR) repeat protein